MDKQDKETEKLSTTLQYQYPNGDISNSGWTPTPSSPATLWDKIDETTPDDTNYISTTAS